MEDEIKAERAEIEEGRDESPILELRVSFVASYRVRFSRAIPGFCRTPLGSCRRVERE